MERRESVYWCTSLVRMGRTALLCSTSHQSTSDFHCQMRHTMPSYLYLKCCCIFAVVLVVKRLFLHSKFDSHPIELYLYAHLISFVIELLVLFIFGA